MSDPAPDTYGDFLGEYRALREGRGLVTSSHEAVTVDGPDAVGFLDALLSQDIASMPEGEVRRSLLLEPRGKMRAALWVGRLPGSVILVGDPGTGELIAGDLRRFLLRTDATIDQPAPVDALVGPAAPEVIATLGLASEGVNAVGPGFVMRADLGRLPRFFAHQLDLEVASSGRLAYDVVRVEEAEPQMLRDIDFKTIPQESGLVESSVAFDKGCFLGQELVARIDSRGHVNRILRGVVVETNVLPPEGAVVEVEGREVGRVTSVGESPAVRAPVGLALIRREVDPPAPARISWPGGEAPAQVVALPLAPV